MSADTEKRFADALEKLSGAMDKIADAVATQAQTNVTLANGVRRMTATIQGAQNAAQDALRQGMADRAQRLDDLSKLDRITKGIKDDAGSQTP